MTDKDHLWLILKVFLCFIIFSDKNLIFEILVSIFCTFCVKNVIFGGDFDMFLRGLGAIEGEFFKLIEWVGRMARPS